MVFDGDAGGVILVGELHADPGTTVALSAFGRNPDHLARHRNLVGFVHDIEQQEDFFSQLVLLFGGNEQAAIGNERHVGRVQHRFVFDGKRQNATTTAGHFHERASYEIIINL